MRQYCRIFLSLKRRCKQPQHPARHAATKGAYGRLFHRLRQAPEAGKTLRTRRFSLTRLWHYYLLFRFGSFGSKHPVDLCDHLLRAPNGIRRLLMAKLQILYSSTRFKKGQGKSNRSLICSSRNNAAAVMLLILPAL